MSIIHHFSIYSPGTWYTEYAWIDTENVTQATCLQRNNTDGYQRIWYPPKFGEAATCLVLPNAPECVQVGWTRDNHLGNSRDGVPLNYTWNIPHFPSGRTKRAVLRIRLAPPSSLYAFASILASLISLILGNF